MRFDSRQLAGAARVGSDIVERVDYDLKRVTIVRARYGGLYEPGTWVAFACWPAELSPDWNADDATCAGFFAERADETGGGDSPQEAHEDLQQRLAARRRRLR